MAWIKSEQALGQHPKIKLLANDLGISIPQAVGHLHLMWWWAVDYAEDGNVTRYKEFIPFAAQWEGEPTDFTKALIKHGWIDELDNELWIHDWLEYTGALIEIRQKDAERKRQSRQRAQSRTSANRVSNQNLNKSTSDGREWVPEADVSDANIPIDIEEVTVNKSTKVVSEGRPTDVHGMSDVDKTRQDKTREDKTTSDSKAITINPSEDLEFPEFDVIVEDMGTRHKVIFSALCNALGYNPKELTSSARGQLNKASKELNDIDVDPQEIPVRARNYLLSFGFKATPIALVKHWASMSKVNPRLTQNELQSLQKQVRSASELDKWANDK
tara:strand:+ start:9764 stop:10750 length:987 start_codon:yes stop_codon:yes gene_type:complete